MSGTRRPRQAALALLAIFLWAAGPAVALAGPQVPALRPGSVQDETSAGLAAADRQRLEQSARAQSGPEQYKILLIDNGGADPWPALPDAVDAAWDLPRETVLLIVGTEIGGRIRFYLGPGASAAGLNPDNVLAAIRARYNPRVREGKLIDGLVDLVAELHTLTGGAAPAPEAAPPPADARAPDRGPGLALPRITWEDLIRQRWVPPLLAVAGGAFVLLGLLGVGTKPGVRRGGRRKGPRSGAS